MFQKMTTVSWPGDENLSEHVWQDEDGTLHLKSLDDDQTTVSLHPNGFIVTVKYLYLLPYKKPEWVEQSFQESNSKIEGFSNRKMKMSYTYTRVRTIFSISSIPSNW